MMVLNLVVGERFEHGNRARVCQRQQPPAQRGARSAVPLGPLQKLRRVHEVDENLFAGADRGEFVGKVGHVLTDHGDLRNGVHRSWVIAS